MMPPKIRSLGDMLETKYLRIEHVHAQFEGFSKDYHIVRFCRRVGIVLLEEDRVMLVRQWRLLPRALVWELPGGTVEDDEDPIGAAVRETEEETGIRCGPLEPLVVYYPGLDNVDNATYIYMCSKFSETGGFSPQQDEIVERRWIGMSEALDMVFRNEITDAMTVAGLTACVAKQAHQN